MRDNIRELIVQAFRDGNPPTILYRGKGPNGEIVMLDFGSQGVQEVPAISYDQAAEAGKLAADAHPEYRLMVKDGTVTQHREPLDFYDRGGTELKVAVKHLSVVRNGTVVYSGTVKQDGEAPQVINSLLTAINRDMKLK